MKMSEQAVRSTRLFQEEGSIGKQIFGFRQDPGFLADLPDADAR